jgi:phosphoglycolate phosphatase
MKADCVIWDWNGTLLDDAWLCVELINQSLLRAGLDSISPEQYEDIFAFPVEDYYRRLGFDFSKISFADTAVAYIREYDRRKYECRLQEGATETIAQLAAWGYSQLVLSAYEQRRLEEMLAHHRLDGYFDRVTGLADSLAAGKLENGTALIRELNLEPDQVVLVGDPDHDFEVAASMGVDCLLIPSGHNSRRRLEACRARLLESINEVPGYLNGGRRITGS